MTKISKLGAFFTMGAIAISFSPSNAHAELSESMRAKKISFYSVRLNRLKNRKSTYAAVQVFARKLAILNPNKARRYYRIALRKFPYSTLDRRAVKLRSLFARMLAKSDLSPSRLRRVLQEVRREEIKSIPPQPTPTPYQAMARPFGGSATSPTRA